MKKSKMFYLPWLILLVGVLFWGIFFLNGEYKYNKMVEEFTRRRFGGLVTNTMEKNRGFHLLKINDDLSHSILTYSIPKSWFFKENSIQIGDSVSKEANDKIMTFYKLKNRRFEKCCMYEIGM